VRQPVARHLLLLGLVLRVLVVLPCCSGVVACAVLSTRLLSPGCVTQRVTLTACGCARQIIAAK
jgi:hypothetical protein